MIDPAIDLLPEVFKERMCELLKEDFQEFINSFGLPRTRGLRLNPDKTTSDELQDLLGVELEPVPWCPTGFAFPSEISLGGQPAHLAGLFYLQEPSSMVVAEATNPGLGAAVVDLAAAPGGKTTHLSSLVGSDGLVVANEVIGSRLRRLHNSLDLWGSQNTVTISRPVDQLASMDVRFDFVVLDAPCSGEGLFRRDPASIRQWSVASVDGAARRQGRLLDESAELVRPDGAMIYSTCTFSIEENERRIAEFLATKRGWELDDLVRWPGVKPGRSMPPSETERTARLWPHHLRGEGQFVARLHRSEEIIPVPALEKHAGGTVRQRHRDTRGTETDESVIRAWKQFHAGVAPGLKAPEHRLIVRGDRIFLLPEQEVPIPVELLARPGLPLGRIRPGRFEPHPALATALRPEDEATRSSYSANSSDLAAFLRGETVPSAGADGWTLVCFEKWGIGWAKRSRGTLKNMLPRHLRHPAIR